jgi:hypothetical protein
MRSTIYLRDNEKLEEDCISPQWYPDKRHAAVVEVLRRLPDAAYNSLVNQIDLIHWFIPDYRSYGKVEPVLATEEFEFVPGKKGKGTRMIYLSPRLEDEEMDVVVGVTAHEIAHVALKHQTIPDNKTYKAQEEEIFNKLNEWGFEQEVEQHRASLAKRGLS